MEENIYVFWEWCTYDGGGMRKLVFDKNSIFEQWLNGLKQDHVYGAPGYYYSLEKDIEKLLPQEQWSSILVQGQAERQVTYEFKDIKELTIIRGREVTVEPEEVKIVVTKYNYLLVGSDRYEK